MIPVIAGEKEFYTSVNKAVAEKQHVSELKDIIKTYENYKAVMVEVFKDLDSADKALDEIFTFRVNYLLKKPVWREFEVEGFQTFNELTESIIDSMGWANDHLHAFYFPEKRNGRVFQYAYSPYSINASGFEDEQYPTYKTDKIWIASVDYEKNSKMKFVFDFGDGHLFDIVYLGKRATTKKDNLEMFPKIIEQRGVGPEQYPEYDEEEK